MTRRKIEFVRLTNERDFPHRSNSHFRRKAFAMFCYRLARSTVNDASQSAAAGIDTRSSHSISDSASQTLRPAECISQSLRWRVLVPRTSEAQAPEVGDASDALVGKRGG